MLNITKTVDGNKLILGLSGRLDSLTVSELEKVIAEEVSDDTNLVLDLADLDYISSAGLRAMLSAQKKLADQGSLLIRNVAQTIIEIFEVTGFVDILNIE